MAAVTAAIAVSAVALGATAYSVVEQKKAAKEARMESDRQVKQQENLIAEAKAKQQATESSAAMNKIRDEARKRQRSAAAGAQGRASTILTSPLGVVGTNPTNQGGKTLLGS
jgi:Tfp pilus assembly major pilin PilA